MIEFKTKPYPGNIGGWGMTLRPIKKHSCLYDVLTKVMNGSDYLRTVIEIFESNKNQP